MSLLNKHVILIEIDWDSGTEGYAYERYRTATLDYQDLVQSIQQIERSCSPLGDMHFPSTSISLYNRDLYFSIKLYSQEYRNRAVRIKIVPPLSGVSSAYTVFTGRIAAATMANGIFQIEVNGNNFEEIFDSTVDTILPVLSRGLFPNMPETQVPTVLPLLYGAITTGTGRELTNPEETPPGGLPAFLIDTEGITDFSWDPHTQAAPNTWTSVAWSPTLGLFAAVSATGSGNRVMTSSDGQIWTSRFSAANEQWNDICWATTLSLFVAVSNNSSSGSGVMTSPDGISWTLRTAASAKDWRAVCWAESLGLLVAVGVNGVMTSTNGTAWTTRTPAQSYQWNDIAFSPTLPLFVAISDSGTGNRVMTSPDGITWTSRTTPKDNSWFGIDWSPKLEVFVAVGQSGAGDRVMVSDDGLTWLLAPSADDFLWYKVRWSPQLEMFAAIASGLGTQAVMTSPDAITWTKRTTPSSVWRGLEWSATLGQFCAVGTDATNGVMLSKTTLVNLFKYAIAASPVAGDTGDYWFTTPGYLHYILHFDKFSTDPNDQYPRLIQLMTAGSATIAYVGFAADQRAEDPQASESRPEIVWFGSGIYDGLIATGVIRNPVTAKQHFMENYTTIPVDAISTPTAETDAEVQHLADTITGPLVPASLGAAIMESTLTIRNVLEMFDRSFGMASFPTHAGDLGTFVNPIGADPTPTLRIDDLSDITKDSFTQDFLREIATGFSVTYSRRYISGQRGDPNANDQYSRKLIYEIPGAKARVFGASSTSPGIVKAIEMPFCRRTGAVINILRSYSEYLRPGAKTVSFALPISFFNQFEIADYLLLSHWQGISSLGGYTDIVCRILGIRVIPDPALPHIEAVAFIRAPGVVYQDNFDYGSDSNSIGGNWLESEANSTDFQIGSASGVLGSSLNINRCLIAGGAATSKSAAFYNVTTENNQCASFQILSRPTAAAFAVSVFVRGSGSRTNFTGYAASLVSTGAGIPLEIRMRKYINANLDSPGGALTEFGVGSLTMESPVPSSSFTWANQGDIIEIRAVGDSIQVYYWSDVPLHNVGLVMSVNDSSISAGVTGILIDTSNTEKAYLTNFYVRGF